MASVDLQMLIEQCLTSYDPTIDLSPGSAAQVEIVTPIVTKFGTDPIDTDIAAFVTDRIQQELPTLYAADPSGIQDGLINPLVLVLTPFQNELNIIKTNQSLAFPDQLDPDDVSSLAANWFDQPQAGGVATGFGRAWFPQPSNVTVEITSKWSNSSSLNFYPVNPISITAEEMAFNQDGNLFFMDVPLQAEQGGDQYNIPASPATGSLISATGVPGAVKIGNPRNFNNGSPQLTSTQFVNQVQQSVNERSLTSRRGDVAIINQQFQTSVLAVAVVGANDPEMQRDILVAASPGDAWMTGVVNLNNKVAYVQIRTIDGDTTDSPNPGDTLYVYLNSTDFPGVPQTSRLVRFTVEEVLSGPNPESPPFQISYFVQWSGEVPRGVILPNPVVLEGGFARVGTVRISSLPDIGPVSLSVPNDAIHVYGHVDIYLRPIIQPLSTVVIASLSDAGISAFLPTETSNDTGAVTEGLDLSTVAASNAVMDPIVDFSAIGVEPGDMLLIDTGSDSGTHIIGQVPGGSTLYLLNNLTTNAAGLRYSILRKIRVNPFSPQILKLPFGEVTAADLATTIGSNVFLFSTNDLITYGAKIGDTIQVLTGPDSGSYLITAFDPVLGGQKVTVNNPVGASGSDLQYQVYTPLNAVQLPLVRLTSLAILDSNQQSTGLTIPPADPVAITPTSDFTSAQVISGSQTNSGYVLPVLGFDYVNSTSVPATIALGGGRFSNGIEVPVGTYKAMLFDNGREDEFDFHNNGSSNCDWFVATSEEIGSAVNYPPIDPAPGECLHIKNGPNKGGYLIQTVYKFSYYTAGGKQIWLYFIQIYGTFPVDVFRQLFTFLDTAQRAGAAGVGITPIDNISGTIAFPEFFTDIFASLGGKLDAALTFYGATSPGPTALQQMVVNLTAVAYEWGDPARGVLRTYFTDPTLFEENTGSNLVPTIFNFTTSSGDTVGFQPDPDFYLTYQIVPTRLDSDTQPTSFPRDLNATTPGTAVLTDIQAFIIGVQVGDVFSVQPQVVFLGTDQTRQPAVQTLAGSNVVTTPAGEGAIFNQQMTGNIVFFDQLDPTNGSTVTSVSADGFSLTLSQAMTSSTPAIITQGSGGVWGWDGTNNFITGSGFTSALVGKYLTLYGVSDGYQGSYPIISVGGTTQLNLDRTSIGFNFPASDATPFFGTAYWIITDAPITAPAVVGNGTVLIGLQPFWMYNSIPTVAVITAISPQLTGSSLTISATIFNGYNQPYQIYRPNVRRITPTEMQEKVLGSLYYFDTQVVSLLPLPIANLTEATSYLTLEPETYEAFGYRHVVADSTRTYSMQEAGYLDLPVSVLPVGLEDNQANFFPLPGSPLQINYEQSTLVQQVQDFITSPEDAPNAASMLARHFLPEYISFFATYSGGKAPSAIAADLIAYINSTPVENPLENSQFIKIIELDGGDPVTPTAIIGLIHDWDRKRWAEVSQDTLGGTETSVPYNGTPRVTYFVPGPNTSGATSISPGAQINLTQS